MQQYLKRQRQSIYFFSLDCFEFIKILNVYIFLKYPNSIATTLYED